MSKTIIVERISYTAFKIDGGKRLKTWARIGTKLKPVTATSETKLRQKLRKISVDLLNGQVEAADLEAGDHREFLAARESLAGLAEKVRVDMVAREYVAARTALAPLGSMALDVAAREYEAARTALGGTPLFEAIRFYQQHHGAAQRRTVREAVAEFMPRLTRLSDAYREVFGYDLMRLVKSHGEASLGDVTTEQLEVFVAATGRTFGGKFHPSSDFRRKQVRGELVTFFNYCRDKRGWLPKKLDHAAHGLEREEAIVEAREVWDPEHLRRALEVVWAHDKDWLPWLAINALANVRSKGARRLDWRELHWLDSLLELKARNSKVKRRVTVGVSPALASWLEPLRRASGPICPEKGFGSFTARLRKKHGLPYYKNVIRRSYITYLLAETDDEDYVARVANTSVAKLRENYRQIRTFSGRLVTKELAAAWLGTARIAAANIVQLELPA